MAAAKNPYVAINRAIYGTRAIVRAGGGRGAKRAVVRSTSAGRRAMSRAGFGASASRTG